MLLRSTVARRRILFAATLATLCTVQAFAAAPIKVEGVSFAGNITVAGQALELNGVGLRAVAWFKGYAAGLYLNARARTPQQVLQNDGAKRLQLQMLQNVDIEEFVKAFDKGIARNALPGELPAMKERVARFDAMLRAIAKVKKRDIVDLDWLPGRGMLFTYNGIVRGEPIPGQDLYTALLKIFVGDKPVDPELKIGLLGGPVG
jgi:Chalcone isomerase-like